MATVPVRVKESMPVPAGSQDIWQSFRGEMDHLLDRFARGFGWGLLPGVRFESSFNMPSPAVDISEDDASFKFSAELPGMAAKDVEVSLSGNTLTIKGEKQQAHEETKKNYHLSERSYGEFRRSFVLPDGVEGGKIDAAFENGVLTVTVPKAAKAAPTKIEVKAA